MASKEGEVLGALAPKKLGQLAALPSSLIYARLIRTSLK